MAFNPDAAIDVVAIGEIPVISIDKASRQQLTALKTALYQRWNAKLRSISGSTAMTMNQVQFNMAYVALLITLASYGSSERLQSHPPIALHASWPDDAEQEGDFTTDWPLINLRECLVTAGISTVRRFARAEADTVYKYWTAHPPAEATAWHTSSGIMPEHHAIAFDFADYIDSALLTVDQRQIVKNARKFTIRTQAALLNENEGASGSMQ